MNDHIFTCARFIRQLINETIKENTKENTRNILIRKENQYWLITTS